VQHLFCSIAAGKILNVCRTNALDSTSRGTWRRTQPSNCVTAGPVQGWKQRARRVRRLRLGQQANSVSRRSTTGLMARYNKTIVQWRSKMQKTTCLSAAEAKYYAASEMAIVVIYQISSPQPHQEHGISSGSAYACIR
jgi:hypothetical protein